MSSHLGQSELVTAAKKGARVGKLRLDLLDEVRDNLLGNRVPLRIRLGHVEAVHRAVDLGRVRIHKHGNPRPPERTAGGVGGGNQVRRIRVGQELRHDPGLDDDLAVVRQSWD